MKRLYILGLLFCASICIIAAQDKKVKKQIIDWGFVPLKGEYLYLQETEVSNRHYYEFIYWLRKNEGLKAYNLMHPDTLVWRSRLAYNEPYVNYYFQHPAYRDYPVVGIAYFQAVAYCNWMAERIMETLEFKNSNIEKIRIRLPSEQEWMMAARGGLPETAIFPWEGNTVRWVDGKKKDEGKIMLNIKMDKGDQGGIASHLSDAGFITTPVDSYWPNNFGLYNMCGNVSELVEEKNKAKGGSWNSLPYNARIDMVERTFGDSISQSTIGFRPLLEIISFKNDSKIKPLTLDAKAIEKQVKFFTDSIGAAIYETTNEFYNLFLNDVKNASDSVRSSGWLQYTLYPYYQQYNRYSKFNQYPVVNITYESALHFCEWLTKKYNQSAHRTYKEVVFKLPSEREWTLAALGKRKFSDYPWGGPYLRNSTGCYLANFNPMEEQFYYKDSLNNYFYRYPGGDSTVSRGVDGAIFPVRTDSYFPNDIGLFQCAGNVAEMTSVKGISKGGSWTSHPYYIQIKSKETYTGSNANLGFRFFMEVKQKW